MLGGCDPLTGITSYQQFAGVGGQQEDVPAADVVDKMIRDRGKRVFDGVETVSVRPWSLRRSITDYELCESGSSGVDGVHWEATVVS